MEDVRVGTVIRAIRIKKGWRQVDVAVRAGISATTISAVERGHVESLSLGTLRRIAAALEVHLALAPRWRGGDLDRLVNADHAALHESIARFFQGLPDWRLAPEVTYSIYGERGVIDVLAWHAPSRTVLVIELETVLADIHDLIGSADRRRRLATRIAAERGWDAECVATWVVLTNTRTNRRRVDAHRTVLRRAFPEAGFAMRRWLKEPSGPIDALTLWPNASGRSVSPGSAGRQRIRRRCVAQRVA